jgi:hypothetical protein
LKKTLGLVLILILALGLIGCSDMGVSDDDSLGYGNIIVSSDIIEVLDGDGNELPDVDLSDVVVKVNGEEGSLGEEITVESGTYDVNVSLTIDETVYAGSKSSVSGKTGETTVVNEGTVKLETSSKTLMYTVKLNNVEAGDEFQFFAKDDASADWSWDHQFSHKDATENFKVGTDTSDSVTFNESEGTAIIEFYTDDYSDELSGLELENLEVAVIGAIGNVEWDAATAAEMNIQY